MKIGIDIGNVLTAKSIQHPRLFASPNYLDIPVKAGAFDGVRFLIKVSGVNNTFLISRCNEGIESNIIGWLHHKRFFEYTHFQSKNVIFCRERSEKTRHRGSPRNLYFY